MQNSSTIIALECNFGWPAKHLLLRGSGPYRELRRLSRVARFLLSIYLPSTIERRPDMTDTSQVPDEIVEQVLHDVSLMVEARYRPLLAKTELFNLGKLEFLLGAQFRIARQARLEGYMIQDCDMCSSWDKATRYCNYYQVQQSTQVRLDYYYQALCPALTLK
jgi:hypothetical protein